jgi:hypothetical protein
MTLARIIAIAVLAHMAFVAARLTAGAQTPPPAAPSSPTTAALTPRITACASERLRNDSQKGNVPMRISMPGRKMATRPSAAPAA